MNRFVYRIKTSIAWVVCRLMGKHYEALRSLYLCCAWNDMVEAQKDQTVRLKFTYQEREILYQRVHDEKIKGEPIDYLEFGVWEGTSIRHWSMINNHPESRFFGFDSFEGLPESWHANPKGTFSTEGKFPEIDDERVNFVKGWFEETLPPFLSSYEQKNRLVVHFDADIYSATLFALVHLIPFVEKGTVVMFDEFSDARHEFSAFLHFIEAIKRPYRGVAARESFDKAAFEIL